MGINIVWTSPVIWKLKSNDTDINPLGKPITTIQVAGISGLVPFGGMIGTLFLTKFCDIIGRRRTLMILSGVMLVSEVALACATHIYMYYVARFIIGLAVGVGVATVSVFLSEISEDHNRGTIGCFIGLSLPVGNLFVFILGPLVSVKMFTLLCTIPNILNLLCFLTFVPESPIYLASKGHKAQTMNSLERIRNKNSDELEKEYESIILTLENTSAKVKPTWGTIFRVRCLRNGFIIALGHRER